MKILRGKHAGKTGRVHQFANDWVMVDLDDGTRGLILKPTMIQLVDDTDRTAFADSDPDSISGQFWKWWRLNDDGTFADLRLRRRP